MPPPAIVAANTLRQTTSDILVVLAEIVHPDLPGGAIRITSHADPVVVVGATYAPEEITLTVPPCGIGTRPQAQFSVVDPGGAYFRVLSQLAPRPRIVVSASIVFVSTPSAIVARTKCIVVDGPAHARGETSLEIAPHAFGEENYPTVRFDQRWRGLF